MIIETCLLVVVFSGRGPAITQFDNCNLCERAKQAVAETYWPDAFAKDEASWTVNQYHIASYHSTKCIPVQAE